MNILILGSGGREHTFAWKLSQSKSVGKLYVAPGNAGTAMCAENVDIPVNDFEKIGSFAIQNNIDIILVGPEKPLVDGIHDFFINDKKYDKIKIIGPVKKAAQLEGSKEFAKEFMVKHNIPTARYKSFTKNELSQGISYIETLNPPYVLKADGLASGKGVVITADKEEAVNILTDMLTKSLFGAASDKVVIEEYLDGIEVSVFVITDGISYKILPPAKDYKRIGEGDTGANTGGMGSVSPVPFADSSFMKKVEERIIIPTIEGLKNENIQYKGFIFLGLMNVKGDPYVIEYNVRMGDPETESVISRIKTDFADILLSVANNNLTNCNIDIDERCAVSVVISSKGYPGSFETNKVIKNLNKVDDSIVFHAGTVNNNNNEIITAGGRVLVITSLDNSIENALSKSLKNASVVDFDGKYYRSDIAKDLIKYNDNYK
jgi:phosphoribosylamine--glycine ligase